VKDCDDGSDLCYADEDGPLANNPRLLLLLTRVSKFFARRSHARLHAEPSPESLQQRGFTFVQGGLTF